MKTILKNLAIDTLVGLVVMVLSLMTVLHIIEANDLIQCNVQESCIKYLSEE